MKTSPIQVSYIQHCGSDLSVVNAARVSFHKESTWEHVLPKEYLEKPSNKLSEKDEKLINYLASHGHISPFHHAFVTLRIKAPIFVARQLVKHKFMPWNEVSRRYVDEEPEFYIPEVRSRADNIKQGSGKEHWASSKIQTNIKSYSEDSLCAYTVLLANKVAPEIARAVLPQNTMTEWIWSGTLSAWASMLSLRLTEYTQQETREVAQECYKIIQPLFPVSIKALVNG